MEAETTREMAAQHDGAFHFRRSSRRPVPAGTTPLHRRAGAVGFQFRVDEIHPGEWSINVAQTNGSACRSVPCVSSSVYRPLASA